MRKSFGAKPLCYPQPVFILAAYDENGVPNAMNAAWGGISEDKEIAMCISAGHKTTKDILARRALTVSMADAQHMAVCVNLSAVCRVGALCGCFPVVLRHRQHAALEVDALRRPRYPLSAVFGVVGRGRGAYLRQGVQDAAR